MEQIPANSTQIGVPEASDEGTSTEGGPNPLDIPLILRLIFLNLPTPDLIKCSEVNKLWNYEARTVLRDFKICVATNKGDRPCCSLRDLDADLSQMTVVPYNGLRVRIRNHPRSLCMQNAEVVFNYLRAHFNLKVLKIDWEPLETRKEPECRAVRLLSFILWDKHTVESLEELEYINFPRHEPTNVFNTIIGIYPKLKRIQFRPRPVPNESLRLFFDIAPNLKTLDMEFDASTLATLASHHKTELIRHFHFQPIMWVHLSREFARQKPKLERLTVTTGTELFPQAEAEQEENINAGSWHPLEPMLLSSAKTLNYLKLELPVLAPVIRSLNVRPLENLETLMIGLNPRWYEDEALLKEIRRVSFTHLFPKINSVTVYEVPGRVRTVRIPWFQPVDLFVELPEDSGRISNLNIRDWYADDVFVKLVEIFPHVTNLTANFHQSDSYLNLWRSYMHLRSARITQLVRSVDFNLDAEFCGIFPAEVEFLQEQDDEFLKSYHLVPVKLGLYTMIWMTQFHIRLHGINNINASSLPMGPRFCFSRVTGYLVLSRMKRLQVTVECNSSTAVRHLESFAKIVQDDG